MKSSSVTGWLFASVLTMAVLPLLASLFFLDHTLETSLNIGFNSQIAKALDDASANLKRLKSVDAANESQYRQQFKVLQDLQLVYSEPDLVRRGVIDSLMIYFGAGLLVAVLLSVLIAAAVSHKISRSYRRATNELLSQQEHLRYLEEIGSWQELAKMLAHEIKNPLTPIEVSVTALTKTYGAKSADEFSRQLAQTAGIVGEELLHLKNLVNRFSEFAQSPQIERNRVGAIEFFRQQIEVLSGLFETAKFALKTDGVAEARQLTIDPTLFRQVLVNIVRNGVEANPKRQIQFTLALTEADESLRLTLANDGAPVPKAIAGRLFEPYVSTKSRKDHMGLGLAIVKKIVVQHDGEIAYAETANGPSFEILLRGSHA